MDATNRLGDCLEKGLVNRCKGRSLAGMIGSSRSQLQCTLFHLILWVLTRLSVSSHSSHLESKFWIAIRESKRPDEVKIFTNEQKFST